MFVAVILVTCAEVVWPTSLIFFISQYQNCRLDVPLMTTFARGVNQALVINGSNVI